MELRVKHFRDRNGESIPTSFTVDHRHFDIFKILDRWDGIDYRYFKIATPDGEIYILRHDLFTDIWSLKSLEGNSI